MATTLPRRTLAPMRRRLVTSLALLSLIAAACGGGSDDTGGTTAEADAPTTTAASTTEVPTTTAAATVDDEPSDDTAEETSTEESTTPTPVESSPIPVIAVEDIPDLIVEWGTGEGDPLDLARRLIGFPLEIATPEGTTPYNVDVRLRGDDPTQDWRWEWSYEAFAAEVGDIDAELPEGGPGTIEGRLHYDPQFEAFGWANSAQVISDPSNGGGGPQSVNWAYSDADGSFRLGEINATPVSARAWVDEDIDFRDGPDQPGHRVDITLESQPNFIPVPLLEALFREVPVAPGARLTTVDFRSYDRLPDSFDAEEGTRYLELSYICELLPNSQNAAQEVYSTGLAGTAYQMGEEDFFNDGFITVTEGQVDGSGVWRQPVIVLDRYPGEISVWTTDDGVVMSEVEVTFEPNREVLQLLEG